MKQHVSSAIVLKRTNYGEADRIIQVITPNQGKLSLMVKGVRKVNSKLAGSIELFCIIDITYLLGRGSIDRLITARLKKHFSNIVKDLDRTNSGYDFIKIINKITEDEVEEEWFSLLSDSMSFLDDFSINLDLVRVWFYLSVFMIMGNTPNLSKDSFGNEFKEKQEYDFDLETMSFTPKEKGAYLANHIKILKLANQFQPTKMVNIQNCEKLSNDLYPLIRSIAKTNLDI
jgi:DNA repair protein RecO (recombination protein O)